MVNMRTLYDIFNIIDCYAHIIYILPDSYINLNNFLLDNKKLANVVTLSPLK